MLPRYRELCKAVILELKCSRVATVCALQRLVIGSPGHFNNSKLNGLAVVHTYGAKRDTEAIGSFVHIYDTRAESDP